MAPLAALALLPLAAASPYALHVRQALPDNYALIQGNITNTVNDVIATNNTVTSFPLNGTDVGFGLIQLLGNSQNLATDLNNTLISLDGSSVLASQESQNVYVSLSGLLGPVFDLLNNFVAHCNTFQNINGAKAAVVSALQAQSTSIALEGAALSSKLAPPFPQSIGVGIGLIQSRFDSALGILTQSSCPPPGSTAFPAGSGGGAAGTVTVTSTVSGAPTTCPTVGGSTVTVTSVTTASAAPGSTVTVTAPAATSTVTAAATTVTVSGAAPPASTVTVSGAAPPASTVTVSGAAPPASTVTVSGAAPPASTVTVSGPGSTVTITAAPGSGPTKTITKTASCTSTYEPPCYFWQPCFASKLSKLHPAPTPYEPNPYEPKPYTA